MNFLLHVVLETLWVLIHDLLKHEIDLHNLTSWGSYECFLGVVTGNIEQVGAKAWDDLTLHDDMLIDLILELLKCLILGSLLPKLLTSLLPQLGLLRLLNLVLLSLPYAIILGLDDSSMVILALEDSINDHISCALGCCLILLQEVGNSTHEPRQDLLLHSSLIWCD